MTLPHDDYELSQRESEEDMDWFLNQPASQFLHYPWPDLDALVGGMLKGELHYVCAFSEGGKSLFMLSLALALAKAGKKVVFLGLEQDRWMLKVQLCCMLIGIEAPEVLSGRAWQWPNWPTMRFRLTQAAWDMAHLPLYLSPVEEITTSTLRASYEHAVGIEADVLMVDHVDHIGGTGQNELAESNNVNRMLHALSRDLQLLTIASSQLNLDAVRADPLGRFRPAQPNHVTMGNMKRRLATSMISLYRPIRQDVTADELKAVRGGEKEATLILAPWQMGVSVMKNRKGGIGGRCILSSYGHHITTLEEKDRYTTSYDGTRRI